MMNIGFTHDNLNMQYIYIYIFRYKGKYICKKENFLRICILSSDVLYQGKYKDFILQRIFINRSKNLIRFKNVK